MKARDLRPRAFRVFKCLETLMKDDARVFKIASQSCLRNKRNGNIFTNFSHVVGTFLVTKKCIVMEICLFRNVFTNAITMLWKIRVYSEFFTLFCMALSH